MSTRKPTQSDELPAFAVGDKVTWTSEASGSRPKTKTGEVVGVVLGGQHPLRGRVEGLAKRFNLAPVQGVAGISARREVSYLVAVPPPPGSRAAAKLYWPVASRLKAAT